jgi:SAM-dependent methyltransferase
VTAVRDLDVPIDDGCRILSPDTVAYSDGAEQRVFDLVVAADDLSSTSDELASQATTWAERYHLATSRSNLLRPFALGSDWTVLEIGAGCGAITRYLGEQCAFVDALEPVFSRARAARARTRDLAGVELLVGSLSDIPSVAAYDLVVVVGVLEYVGEGSSDLSDQRTFLRQIEAVLKPGGSLFLAIENKLGVKYLAGAGEDHTGRVYDSVEGYPQGTIARTFSRTELSKLFEGAGFDATFYAAFPDYKLTRTVMSDGLFEVEPALAWRIPQFPSPGRVDVAARTVSEERLWRSLVEDGVGPNFSNSFIVTGSKGAERGPGELWTADQLAAFYQPDRRAAYATETIVSGRDGTIHFDRAPLRISSQSSALAMVLKPSTLVPGRDLVEVLEEADEGQLASYLGRWITIADRVAEETGGYPFDLFPHNLVEDLDGELRVIDEEWSPSQYSRDEFLARGILVTAWKLALRTPAGRWPCETFGELVMHLGGLVGLPADERWLAMAVSHEATLESEVLIETGWEMRGTTQLESVEEGLKVTLGMPLRDLPMGDRDHQRLASEQERLRQAAETINDLVAALEQSGALLERMHQSTSWRLTEPVRRATGMVQRLRT